MALSGYDPLSLALFRYELLPFAVRNLPSRDFSPQEQQYIERLINQITHLLLQRQLVDLRHLNHGTRYFLTELPDLSRWSWNDLKKCENLLAIQMNVEVPHDQMHAEVPHDAQALIPYLGTPTASSTAVDSSSTSDPDDFIYINTKDLAAHSGTPAASSSSDRSLQVIRQVTGAFVAALTTPVFNGSVDGKWEACNIDVVEYIDEKPHFKRVLIPNLSHEDYTSTAYGGNYTGIGINQLTYNAQTGDCYTGLALGLTREEADERYEELVTQFGLERHALHTTGVVSLSANIYQRMSSEYAEEQRLQRQQLRATREGLLEAAVRKWKATGLFQTVMYPPHEYLINVMGYAPEYVACNDTVLFIYKKLPLQPTPKGEIPKSRHVDDVSVIQRTEAREYYDRLAQEAEAIKYRPWKWFKSKETF